MAGAAAVCSAWPALALSSRMRSASASRAPSLVAGTDVVSLRRLTSASLLGALLMFGAAWCRYFLRVRRELIHFFDYSRYAAFRTPLYATRLPHPVAVVLDLADRHTGLLGAAVHHSMTWSARSSSDGGMVRLRARAVLRLMMRSNLFGCSIGISAGFAPFRILSTYLAARRQRSL